MTRLLRPRYLAVLVAAALVLALGISVGVLVARQSSTKQGKILVLLTVDVPVPADPAALTGEAVGLRLLPAASGSSWLAVTVRATKLNLPGNWEAPNSDSLFLESVPVGAYRGAELVVKSSSGRTLDDSQKVVMNVTRSGLTPLLFTFQASSARISSTGSSISEAAAYGGNDQVNFGLEVAQGKVLSVPSVPLVNQEDQPFSFTRYQGKVVVHGLLPD